MNLRNPKVLFVLGLLTALAAVFIYNTLAGRQTALAPIA